MTINYKPQHCEHDGCDGCEYGHLSADAEPCKSCKQNYMDMWTKKKEHKPLIDKTELLDKLFTLADDAQTEDEKNGLLQAIAVTLMSERADDETDGI